MSDFVPKEEFMRFAIEKAREGATQGQWPYGACLVKNDEVVTCGYSVVRQGMDPTAHAEIQAIRESCAKLKSLDLTGCEMYATCEPCPMCFTACHSAKVSTIVYGANREDSPNAGARGRLITSHQVKGLLESPVQLVHGFLRDEALQLFSIRM